MNNCARDRAFFNRSNLDWVESWIKCVEKWRLKKRNITRTVSLISIFLSPTYDEFNIGMQQSIVT